MAPLDPQHVQQMLKQICDLTIVSTCGGGTGAVFKVQDNKNHIKVLKLFKPIDLDHGPSNPYEVTISSSFCHPNVSCFRSIVVLGDADILGGIMDCASKSLIEVMNSSTFTFNERLNFVHQAIKGLSFMHSNGYLHLDIKVDNVLIKNGVAQLADFGHSGKMDSDGLMVSNLQLMTPLYRPPEILSSKAPYNYSIRTESWCIGHLIVMTCFGRSFFPTGSYKDQSLGVNFILGTFEQRRSELIQSCCGTEPRYGDGFSRVGLRNTIHRDLKVRLKCAASLLTKLLDYKPYNRPSSFEILQDPLFQGLQPVKIEEGYIQPRIRYSTPPDTSYYVQQICQLMIREWKDESAKLLFSAVDLYIRSSVHISTVQNTECQCFEMVVAASCCWIGHKIMGNNVNSVLKTLASWAQTTTRYISQVELAIIAWLGGNLTPNYVYEVCRGANHLRRSYSQVICGDPNVYADIDLEVWAQMLGEPVGSPYLTIGELQANLA